MKEAYEDRYVSIPEVKKILKEDSNNDGFSYEKREILRHAELFTFLSLTNIKKLIKKLQKIERVNSYYAHKLAEILPQTKEELGTIFAKEIMSPTEEELNEILDTIKEFV